MKSTQLIWLLLLFPLFIAAKPGDDPMGDISDLWFDHQPQSAFEMILETDYDDSSRESLRLAEKLTKLTGVRKIEKMLEGKGDETAYFINDKYVALVGFYHSLRFVDMASGASFAIPGESFPMVDKQGYILYKSDKTYYLKADNDLYILYELSLTSKASRSLGRFPLDVFMTKYDEEQGLLQFNGLDYDFMATFDLDKRKKIETSDRIMQRPQMEAVKVDITTGHAKLTLRFNDEKVSIPYSYEEFLYAYNPESNFYLDSVHPESILMEANWYPGMWFLVDIANKRVKKIFVPHWLEPGMKVAWHVTSSGDLFFWKVAGERAGLYKIAHAEYPSFSDFIRLIEKYNLAHRKSGVGNSERA